MQKLIGHGHSPQFDCASQQFESGKHPASQTPETPIQSIAKAKMTPAQSSSNLSANAPEFFADLPSESSALSAVQETALATIQRPPTPPAASTPSVPTPSPNSLTPPQLQRQTTQLNHPYPINPKTHLPIYALPMSPNYKPPVLPITGDSTVKALRNHATETNMRIGITQHGSMNRTVLVDEPATDKDLDLKIWGPRSFDIKWPIATLLLNQYLDYLSNLDHSSMVFATEIEQGFLSPIFNTWKKDFQSPNPAAANNQKPLSKDFFEQNCALIRKNNTKFLNQIYRETRQFHPINPKLDIEKAQKKFIESLEFTIVTTQNSFLKHVYELRETIYLSYASRPGATIHYDRTKEIPIETRYGTLIQIGHENIDIGLKFEDLKNLRHIDAPISTIQSLYIDVETGIYFGNNNNPQAAIKDMEFEQCDLFDLASTPNSLESILRLLMNRIYIRDLKKSVGKIFTNVNEFFARALESFIPDFLRKKYQDNQLAVIPLFLNMMKLLTYVDKEKDLEVHNKLLQILSPKCLLNPSITPSIKVLISYPQLANDLYTLYQGILFYQSLIKPAENNPLTIVPHPIEEKPKPVPQSIENAQPELEQKQEEETLPLQHKPLPFKFVFGGGKPTYFMPESTFNLKEWLEAFDRVATELHTTAPRQVDAAYSCTPADKLSFFHFFSRDIPLTLQGKLRFHAAFASLENCPYIDNQSISSLPPHFIAILDGLNLIETAPGDSNKLLLQKTSVSLPEIVPTLLTTYKKSQGETKDQIKDWFLTHFNEWFKTDVKLQDILDAIPEVKAKIFSHLSDPANEEGFLNLPKAKNPGDVNPILSIPETASALLKIYKNPKCIIKERIRIWFQTHIADWIKSDLKLQDLLTIIPEMGEIILAYAKEQINAEIQHLSKIKEQRSEAKEEEVKEEKPVYEKTELLVHLSKTKGTKAEFKKSFRSLADEFNNQLTPTQRLEIKLQIVCDLCSDINCLTSKEIQPYVEQIPKLLEAVNILSVTQQQNLAQLSALIVDFYLAKPKIKLPSFNSILIKNIQFSQADDKASIALHIKMLTILSQEAKTKIPKELNELKNLKTSILEPLYRKFHSSDQLIEQLFPHVTPEILKKLVEFECESLKEWTKQLNQALLPEPVITPSVVKTLVRTMSASEDKGLLQLLFPLLVKHSQHFLDWTWNILVIASKPKFQELKYHSQILDFLTANPSILAQKSSAKTLFFRYLATHLETNRKTILEKDLDQIRIMIHEFLKQKKPLEADESQLLNTLFIHLIYAYQRIHSSPQLLLAVSETPPEAAAASLEVIPSQQGQPEVINAFDQLLQLVELYPKLNTEKLSLFLIDILKSNQPLQETCISLVKRFCPAASSGQESTLRTLIASIDLAFLKNHSSQTLREIYDLVSVAHLTPILINELKYNIFENIQHSLSKDNTGEITLNPTNLQKYTFFLTEKFTELSPLISSQENAELIERFFYLYIKFLYKANHPKSVAIAKSAAPAAAAEPSLDAVPNEYPDQILKKIVSDLQQFMVLHFSKMRIDEFVKILELINSFLGTIEEPQKMPKDIARGLSDLFSQIDINVFIDKDYLTPKNVPTPKKKTERKAAGSAHSSSMVVPTVDREKVIKKVISTYYELVIATKFRDAATNQILIKLVQKIASIHTISTLPVTYDLLLIKLNEILLISLVTTEAPIETTIALLKITFNLWQTVGTWRSLSFLSTDSKLQKAMGQATGCMLTMMEITFTALLNLSYVTSFIEIQLVNPSPDLFNSPIPQELADNPQELKLWLLNQFSDSITSGNSCSSPFLKAFVEFLAARLTCADNPKALPLQVISMLHQCIKTRKLRIDNPFDGTFELNALILDTFNEFEVQTDEAGYVEAAIAEIRVIKNRMENLIKRKALDIVGTELKMNDEYMQRKMDEIAPTLDHLRLADVQALIGLQREVKRKALTTTLLQNCRSILTLNRDAVINKMEENWKLILTTFNLTEPLLESAAALPIEAKM